MTTRFAQAERFEAEARQVKLTGLELALNRVSAFQGSPVRAVDLLSWNRWNWIQLAERAGTTIPSQTTRDAFIERIAARDAAVLAANGAGR
jgi:hypothetical protein